MLIAKQHGDLEARESPKNTPTSGRHYLDKNRTRHTTYVVPHFHQSQQMCFAAT